MIGEQTQLTDREIALLRARTPVWMQPYADAEALRPVAGARPAEGLAASTETAGRATPPRTPEGFGSLRAPLVTDGPLAPVERALARPQTSTADTLKAGADRVIREAYDRFYPLRELDDLAGTDPLRGAHASAQVVSGAIAAGEDNVRRHVLPIIKGLGRDAPYLERYWLLKAAEDVVSRNPEFVAPFLKRGYIPGMIPEQPLPHVGMERFMEEFLSDFSTEPLAVDPGIWPPIQERLDAEAAQRAEHSEQQLR